LLDAVALLLIICCSYSYCDLTPTCPYTCAQPLQVGSISLDQDAGAAYQELRGPKAVETLIVAPFDVLCLQDIPDAGLTDLITTNVELYFPYSYTPPRVAQNGCSHGCNLSDVEGIATCLDTACEAVATNPESTSDDIFLCVVTNCSAALSHLSSTCLACLTNNASLSIFDKFNPSNTGSCQNFDKTSADQCVNTFDGQSGVTILSKWPITESGSFVYSPIQGDLARAAAYIKISHPAFGNVKVITTQLFPVYPSVPFINGEEMSAFSDFAINVTNVGDTVLLLGDFQSGPQLGANVAQYNSSWIELLAAGWEDAQLLTNSQACTWCPGSNPLAVGFPQGIWDHILYRNSNMNGCLQNFGIWATENNTDIGKSQFVPISSRYGVSASFCPPPAATTGVAPPTSPAVRTYPTAEITPGLFSAGVTLETAAFVQLALVTMASVVIILISP